MKKQTEQCNGDLQLVALLVAKTLMTEYLIATPPSLSNFEIKREGLRYQGRCELRVNVELGRGVSIGIDDIWGEDGDRNVTDLLETSRDLSRQAARVLGNASEIRRMLSDVRASVKREVVKASKRGLSYRLVAVELSPIVVDFSDGAVVDVEVEVLGRSLQPHTFAFDATCAADVAAEFAGMREEQDERAFKRAALDREGATGLIDAVLLASVRDSGVDVATVLSQLKEEEWIVDAVGPDNRNITLHWDEGTVYGHVTLGDGINWHEGRIHFEKPTFAGADVKGKPLSKVLDHPFVDGDLLIRSGAGRRGESAALYCEPPLLLFNSATGEVWQV